MTGGGIRIELPFPPAKLSPNAKRRKQWWAYQPTANKYRLDCNLLTQVTLQRRGVDCAGLRLASVTFVPPDRRRRDDDGMIGAFKHGRDGVADALGCDDHSFRPSYHFADPEKPGRVIIELIPSEEGGE